MSDENVKGEELQESDDVAMIGLDLKATSVETLELFVEESSDPELFQEILDQNRDREEVLKLLYRHPNTPLEIKREVASALNLPVPTEEEMAILKGLAAKKAEDEPKARESLIKKISKLKVAERVKLGLKGNGEARKILMKESNKLVIMAVLGNPRITEGEIETMAKSRNIIEDALRRIAKNREWSKNYSIQHALVTNPKTPPGLAMKYVPYMSKKDLAMIEKDKNVSEAVRALAKKLVKQKKD